MALYQESYTTEDGTYVHAIGETIPPHKWIPKMVFGFLGREWFKFGVLLCLFGVLLCIFWIALNIEWVVYTGANGRGWWRVNQ